ncbi:hypothetical protein [Paenibacillus sp. MMS20-IR301]|uniref:hypothetical protein n=1 Tax=Paenibacillus sp. MMS20-IR301 TaxID=2895946 RepID=UPI0028F09169|nr:hypothetical protein [Paenibacillus sp. MMS20-IR301]WNS41103.1 hypothetical protein LOS79_18880 [Paenibacillus sp. MMS20-IR301]
MFRRLKQRMDNANEMNKMRKQNPEEIQRALEKYRSKGQTLPPAESGPVILVARLLLYLLTVLILLVIFIGVPLADNPIFSLFSFGLLLSLLYMAASLAHPAIVFFRKKRSRLFALELFGLISCVFLFLLAVFHT